VPFTDKYNQGHPRARAIRHPEWTWPTGESVTSICAASRCPKGPSKYRAAQNMKGWPQEIERSPLLAAKPQFFEQSTSGAQST